MFRPLSRHLTSALIVGEKSCQVVRSVLRGVESRPELAGHLAEAGLAALYLSDICLNIGQKTLLGGQVEILLALSLSEGREQELDMSDALVGQAEALAEGGQVTVVTGLITPAGGSAGAELSDNVQMIVSHARICKSLRVRFASGFA